VDNCITWIGLDAHKEFVSVAMRQSGSKEFVETKVPNEPESIRSLHTVAGSSGRPARKSHAGRRRHRPRS
jgi:hypothetical protein